MDVLKPINLSTKELDETELLTRVEMGKLWATYVGNRMSSNIARTNILKHYWKMVQP
jgi:hypothetical protein